jgi:hypothetical protein
MEVVMEFPDREVAEAWVGRTLVDRDGVEIGACTQVLFDDATHVTEWVCCEVAGAAVFIPAVDAAEVDDIVQVGVSRDDVAGAPSVGDAQHISAEDEATLYRHYGMPHSREASPTLLPIGQEEEPAVDSESDRERVDAAAAAPVTTQVSDVAETGQPASEEGLAQPGEPAGSTGVRRLIMPTVAGLASVAAAIAVALRVRRLRRRPLTRRERLVRRSRAASGAMAARAGRIAASATPVVETTKQVARRGGPAGAVAAGVPAAAALLGVVRRRRSINGRVNDQE